MTRSSTVFAVALGLCAAIGACNLAGVSELEADNPIRPDPPPPYGIQEFFAGQTPLNPERVRLGRWLFFDRRLSADETVSCATCHRPEHAFSEAQPTATGIRGQRGPRRTPSIINLGARTILPDTESDVGPAFFWDGRATSLEEQVLIPIADPREMGMAHGAMVSRLNDIGGYRKYFERAFGSRDITKERVASALAEYVRSRRSGNAPYDRWAYGKDGRALSAEAQHGVDIFFFTGRCATCHAGFNFSDGRFHSLGIGWDEATQKFRDEGRAAVTGRPEDRGRFKTPGLRDVEKRPPYMHDGSLATLRDVVEFYNRGGNRNAPQSGRLVPLKMTDADIDAVVSFLRALSGEGYEDQPPRFFPR
ncbi:MAG TPA: cytochrome c peroxidase [Vicinamibacterales bacterium]|nr:cytochrome c peroxidase [Vicinamibacterales bacterium]